MSDDEYKIYKSLVSGQYSLDDGEAATIAIASCRNQLPVIDERRGRLKARIHCPNKPLNWSLDLFLHPNVIKELGAIDSIDALYLALLNGRMRIDESHCDHVVNLIGFQHALECSSLPGYKIRRQKWQ